MTNDRRRPSVFDYTVTLSRRHRYLMVGCPEFPGEIPARFLQLSELSEAGVGEAVLQIFDRIHRQLLLADREGRVPPRPLGGRKNLSVRQAAMLLDLRPGELRQLARKSSIEHFRTPGGHFRFPLEGLSRYLVEERLQLPSEPGARTLPPTPQAA